MTVATDDACVLVTVLALRICTVEYRKCYPNGPAPPKSVMTEERLTSKMEYWHFCSGFGKDLKFLPSGMVVPFDRSSTSVVILAVCLYLCIYTFMHIQIYIYTSVL